MTTAYECTAFFTKNGNGVAPSSAPTICVVDSANNILVAAATAVTALSNLVGAYRYSYSGADGLTVYYVFTTTDLTVDQYQIAGVPNINPVVRDVQTRLPAALTANGNMKSSLLEIITTALSEGAAGRIAAAFQLAFNVASSVWTAASVNQTGDAYNVVKSGGAGDAAAIKTQADKLAAGLVPISGAVVSVTDSGEFTTNLSETLDDAYPAMTLVFTSGQNTGRGDFVSGYTGATKTILMPGYLPYDPAPGDTFVLIPIGTDAINVLGNISTTRDEVDGLKGTDGKAIISTDAQDLSATLHVDAKTLDGAAPNNAPDVSTNVGLIKAKTDNLPSDPADESLLEAYILAHAGTGMTAAETRTALGMALANMDTQLASLSKPGTAQTITPPADMALNSTVAKDATVSKPGTAQTITPPADMALNSTVAKAAALTTLQGNVTTILADYARRTGDYATAAALTALQGNVTTILSDYARRTGDYATVSAIASALLYLGVDIKKINGVTIQGNGSTTPWGPA